MGSRCVKRLPVGKTADWAACASVQSLLLPLLRCFVVFIIIGALSGQLLSAATAPIATIHGRVIDLAGKPATNVWVQLQTLDPTAPEFARTGGWALASTNSGSNGEFALSVAALPPTWALLALQGENVAWHERLPLATPSSAGSIRLELRPWPRINGSIRALDESSVGSVGIEIESTAVHSVPPAEAAPANVATGDKLKPGLVGEMFVIPDEGQKPLDDTRFISTPIFRRIDAQINHAPLLGRFGDTALSEFFAVRWAGVLRCPKNGEYQLSLLSNDGGRVSIDGRPVLRDEEIRAARSVTERVQLSAGDHELLVEFFQGYGVHACVLSWNPPGGTSEVIPPSALFHARRHLKPAAARISQRPQREFTDAEGGFSVKMIPGLRYERVRTLAANGWQELAAADQLRIDFSQATQPRAFKIQPLDKGLWRIYTTVDGLPSDDVRRILFARDGAAWFATGRGAARFDGREFQSLSRADGLLDDSVFSLCETRDGALWLGGATGASRFKDQTSVKPAKLVEKMWKFNSLKRSEKRGRVEDRLEEFLAGSSAEG